MKLDISCMSRCFHSSFILCSFSINLINVFGSYSQEKYNYLFEKYLKILLPLKWPNCVLPKDYLVLKCICGNDGCIDLPLSILCFWNRVVYGFSLEFHPDHQAYDHCQNCFPLFCPDPEETFSQFLPPLHLIAMNSTI